jgi:hypothetical protein
VSKKTVQLNVAVTPDTLARARRLQKHTGLKPTEIARDGLVRELERLEQHANPVTPKVAKAIASYRKVTGRDDVDLILADAMRAHIQRASQCPARDSAAA